MFYQVLINVKLWTHIFCLFFFFFLSFFYIFLLILPIFICAKNYIKFRFFKSSLNRKSCLRFFGITDYIYGSLFKDRGKLYNLIRIWRHQFYLHSLCTCILELTSHIYCYETFSSKIVFKFTKVYIVELSHTVCKSYILCKNVFSTPVVLLL